MCYLWNIWQLLTKYHFSLAYNFSSNSIWQCLCASWSVFHVLQWHLQMSFTILQFSNEAAQTGLFLVAISWKSSKEKGYLEENGRGENTKNKWGNTFPARLNVRLQFKDAIMVGNCCQIQMTEKWWVWFYRCYRICHIWPWVMGQILNRCKNSKASKMSNGWWEVIPDEDQPQVILVTYVYHIHREA